jgi:transcription initiation factor IIE alpha subunit
MADSAFLTRLRTGDGPSHLLLVLLNQHRVMTTDQLARATGTPERTVRYRLDRLHDAGLIAYARPGRESGSAPRHWWLRPTGARLVAGTAAGEGKPSAMFAAHAAAITEVWLAVTEHGPAHGIQVEEWLTDRAGWQEREAGTYWSRRYRLTPDAVAHVQMPDGSSAVAFIEVDLATMTQTLLKEKVARYLAYAADRAWEGIHPYCPPMLLLTTTATRAATFVRAAGQLITQHEDRLPFEDPADVLVVAACGYVRDPARAITEACWKVPDAAAAELTLTDLLAERLDAQIETEDRDAQDAAAQRLADLDVLRELRDVEALADLLNSPPAAEALHALIGGDPAAFIEREPELAAKVLEWGRHWRRIPRSERRERAQPLVPELEARHAALWAQQARLLLSSQEHLAAAEPRLCRLVTTMANGHLADETEIDMLRAAPSRTRQRLRQDAWGDYPAQRQAVVEAHWDALTRRARRQTSREHLSDAYDNEHLIICDTCQIVYLKVGPNTLLQQYCPHCDGTIVEWADRARIVSLPRRVGEIRRRLGDTVR